METTDATRSEPRTSSRTFAALVSILAPLAVVGCATIGEDEIEPGAEISRAALDVDPENARSSSWNGYRGAGRDAIAHGESLPETLAASVWKENWRVSVGDGLSGPIAAFGLVFCHSRREDNEVVSAHRIEDGALVWESSHEIAGFSQPIEAWAITSGPLATPTVIDGRVYTVGVHGFVQCFEAATGRRIFAVGSRDIDEATSSHRFGHSTSPLVHDGKLYISFSTEARTGAREEGHLLALDATTGQVLWRALPETIAYPSPVLARIHGVDQLVVRSWLRVCGLDPSNGKILWEHHAEAGGFTRDCVTPLVVGNVVVLSNNNHGTIAIEVEPGVDGELSARRLYRTGHLGCRTSSPIYHAGALFSTHQRGRLVCVDATNGQRRWVARALGDHTSFVQVGSRALALSEDGDLELIELSSERYSPLARWKVGKYTWAQPALSRGRLYIRDGGDLVSLRAETATQ